MSNDKMGNHEPGESPPGKLNEMRIHFTPRGNKYLAFLLALLPLVFILGACTPDENEIFIQGGWYYNDQHIQEVVGESYVETTWYFDRGTYETYTCCFVEFQQFGRYDILESEGDRIVLDLFNIDGKFNSERVQLGITIDREADTIKLPGAGPFIRTGP